jgi:hypothetical protein
LLNMAGSFCTLLAVGAAAGALLAGDPTPGAGAFCAAAALAAAACFRFAHVPVVPWRLRLAADGGLTVMHGEAGNGVARPARIAAFNPGVVVLAVSGRRLPVWRDSLPAAAYRRLAVSARWHVSRAGDPAPARPIAD